MSLMSFPDDLLIEIASCCASSSLSDFRNLSSVCKKFHSICDTRPVLFRLSLQESEFYPYWSYPYQHYKKYQKLHNNGNPESLYRLGIIYYFYDNKKDEGLKLLQEASEKGFHEAMYLYGVILICFGGTSKEKGFKIMSSYIMPLLSATNECLERVRRKINRYLNPNARVVLKELERSYIKETCDCDGKTTKFLYYNSFWHKYGADNDMNTSSTCEFCLWDYVVTRLMTGA